MEIIRWRKHGRGGNNKVEVKRTWRRWRKHGEAGDNKVEAKGVWRR